MTTSVALSTFTETTLGDWAATLAPGSTCFCCEGTLHDTALDGESSVALGRGLKCPRCGAEVSGQSGVEAGMMALSGAEPLVPAAA